MVKAVGCGSAIAGSIPVIRLYREIKKEYFDGSFNPWYILIIIKQSN